MTSTAIPMTREAEVAVGQAADGDNRLWSVTTIRFRAGRTTMTIVASTA